MSAIRHAARVAIALAAAILVAAPALAADAPPSPHSVELVKKLFAEMQMNQMMSGMMRQMAPAMEQQARQANPNLSAADAKAITEAAAESMDVMMVKVMDRMVPLYASTFSEKELQDLVAFYDSPTGRAMLTKMPVLMSKVAPTMVELMPEMTADMRQRICAKTDCTKRSASPAPKT